MVAHAETLSMDALRALLERVSRGERMIFEMMGHRVALVPAEDVEDLNEADAAWSRFAEESMKEEGERVPFHQVKEADCPTPSI